MAQDRLCTCRQTSHRGCCTGLWACDFPLPPPPVGTGLTFHLFPHSDEEESLSSWHCESQTTHKDYAFVKEVSNVLQDPHSGTRCKCFIKEKKVLMQSIWWSSPLTTSGILCFLFLGSCLFTGFFSVSKKLAFIYLLLPSFFFLFFRYMLL